MDAAARMIVDLDGFSTDERALLSAAIDGAGLTRDAVAAPELLLVREDGDGRWRAALRGVRGAGVLVSAEPGREQLEEAIELGAAGYLRLPGSPDELPGFVSALRFALEGQFVCEERLVRALVDAT